MYDRSIPRTLEDYKQEWVDEGIKYGLCLCGCGGETNLTAHSNLRPRSVFYKQPARFVRGHRAGTRVGVENRSEIQCTRCKKILSVTLFSKRNPDASSNHTRYYSWCRDCDTASKRNTWYVNQYGITEKEVLQMKEIQNSCCDICGIEFSKQSGMAVDHDHETGAVRALLCRACNAGLGQFRDNPEILIKASAYITKHKNVDAVTQRNT